jgi:hypothetical protein
LYLGNGHRHRHRIGFIPKQLSYVSLDSCLLPYRHRNRHRHFHLNGHWNFNGDINRHWNFHGDINRDRDFYRHIHWVGHLNVNRYGNGFIFGKRRRVGW